MSTEDYFDVNINIVKWAGLWIPDQGESSAMKCVYLVFNGIFIGYSVVFNIPMEWLAFRFTYHTLDALMKNVALCATHTLAAVKMFVWYRNRKEILRVMRELQEKAAEYEAIDDFEPTKIIKKEKSLKDFTSRMFLFISIAAMWTLFTDYTKYEQISIAPDNTTIYRYTQKLPYYAQMPFVYDSSKIRFAISLIYNCFPCYHFAWIIIGIDTICTSLQSYLSVHLQILQGAFRTIRPRCLQKLEIPNSTGQDFEKLISKAMIAEMNRCVDHLQLIFRTCEQVESIFSYLTLIHVFSSQIITCACLYMVSAIPITSIAFATELSLLLAIQMQIFLYCFFGNKVTLTGDDVSLALYEGDWLSSNGSFKRSMLITMTRMRKPIYFTMGKFSPLTLGTFVMIQRVSYSFFAVIKNG